MMQALDENHIAGLREVVGDEGLAMIASAFLADLPGLRMAVEAAIEARDEVALRRAIHTFQGAGAAVGFDVEAAFAQRLRSWALSGYWPDRASTAGEISNALAGPLRRIGEIAQPHQQWECA